MVLRPPPPGNTPGRAAVSPASDVQFVRQALRGVPGLARVFLTKARVAGGARWGPPCDVRSKRTLARHPIGFPGGARNIGRIQSFARVARRVLSWSVPREARWCHSPALALRCRSNLLPCDVRERSRL
jgi:hypothetical protein